MWFCLSLSVKFSMARAHALGAVIFLLLELPGWWMDSSLRFSPWASVDVDSVACHFYALNPSLLNSCCCCSASSRKVLLHFCMCLSHFFPCDPFVCSFCFILILFFSKYTFKIVMDFFLNETSFNPLVIIFTLK